MVHFCLIERFDDDSPLFGIAVKENGKTVVSYPDVSRSKEEAERLRRQMERSDLSPVHYDDVVRDYLVELMYERMERNGL